jgi:hypothetical protein
MRRILAAAFLGGMLFTPMTLRVRADEHRYYDRDHRDYHEWNEAEQRAYRHWLTEERHRQYHDWDRASARERRDYWRWRHDHRDWH